MVSSDDRDSAKKGTQLSLFEESCFNKKSEKQLRSRYDQFISSKYIAVSRLTKCKGNKSSLPHQHFQNLQPFLDSFIIFPSSILQKFHCV